jgi:hypothetical protein
MWNVEMNHVQEERVARSPLQILPVCEELFGTRPIRILEIGVFRAGLSERLRHSTLNIAEYIGVDPYLGTTVDPYRGVYWKNESGADAIWRESAEKFQSWGFTLLRMGSQEFFSSSKADGPFDLIYVDGDHRLKPALWDLCTAFARISPNGIMAVDDYANVDAPDVTRAFNKFCDIHSQNIRRMGYVENSFVNPGKFVPVVQRTVFVQPNETMLPVSVPSLTAPAAKAKPVTTLDRILDISPRKVINRVKRSLP